MRVRAQKKRSITLIQLLIAISLMAAVSGVVGLNVYRALAQERFFSSIDRLTQKLRLAQGIMLSCGVDTRVVLTREQEIVYCTVEALDSVSSNLMRLMGDPESLDGIDIFYFTESGQGVFQQQGSVEVSFLASGEQVTAGLIEVGAAEEGLKRYIWLPGYPTHIRAVVEPPTKIDSLLGPEENEALLPYEE